jgi:hypothetical protein
LAAEILDHPGKAGDKIIRLLLRRSGFTTEGGSNPAGTMFDVLLSQAGTSGT